MSDGIAFVVCMSPPTLGETTPYSSEDPQLLHNPASARSPPRSSKNALGVSTTPPSWMASNFWALIALGRYHLFICLVSTLGWGVVVNIMS